MRGWTPICPKCKSAAIDEGPKAPNERKAKRLACRRCKFEGPRANFQRLEDHLSDGRDGTIHDFREWAWSSRTIPLSDE